MPHAPSSVCRRSGFTLLELLSAITVLTVIIWILAAIFRESDRAWNMGTSRVDLNTEGRAALTAIANDLRYAICDETMTFVIQPERKPVTDPSSGRVIYGRDNQEICFVSLADAGARTDSRAAREIFYYPTLTSTNRAGKYSIMRIENVATNSYLSSTWFEGASPQNRPRGFRAVVAENITALNFFVPDPLNPNGADISVYDSSNSAIAQSYHQLPPYVDVVVEVLSDEAAEKLNIMSSAGSVTQAERMDFLEQNARRFVRRVFLQNGAGYQPRGTYP